MCEKVRFLCSRKKSIMGFTSQFRCSECKTNGPRTLPLNNETCRAQVCPL